LKVKFKEFERKFNERVISHYNRLEASNQDISEHQKVDHGFLKKYIHRSDYVLEVGCGTGNYTFDTAKLARKVDGIDIVNKFVQALKKYSIQKNVSNVKIYNKNIYDVNYSNQYDRVLFSRSLSNLCNPIKGLRKARRSIKSDGSVIVIESENYPSPAGESFPTFWDIALTVAKEIDIQSLDILNKLNFPLIVSREWIKELASLSQMTLLRQNKIGSFYAIPLEDELEIFVTELGKG